MAVQYSTQSVVSDGTLSTIVLGIKYILRTSIYLRIGGVETPQTGAPSGYTWSFLDATTIRVLPVVPTGITVEVYRRTDITGMYNVFSQNAQFDEGTIDENNTQLLYIAQEYLEQDLTGVGIASLEYVRSEPGYEIYRFQRLDGTYLPEFPVPTDTAALETHKLSTNQHHISGVTGLLDELSQLSARIDTNADPVLDVRWLSKRSPMRTGYAAGDGQTLPRALYPDAVAAIQAGLVPVCTDADWLADPSKRGCYTLGDGATTFRVPDYNGKSEGSLGAPVFRGDGKNSAPVGHVQGDAIRNIEGTWTEFYGGLSNDPSKYSGAFELVSSATGNAGNNLSVTKGITAKFSAARVVPTAEENRMVNVAGCWGIKLFGAVQNAGSADAAALATAVADLAARVSVLETRKYTTLIPATLPAGAPHDTHETVETQLPTTISNDTRYVLPNPFGANARVQAIAELYVNGKWAEPGWDGNTGTGALAYGVRATYVQGEGIVVQTGATTVIVASKLGGGGHGYSGASLTSAPCRVFVRKLEA